MQNLHCETGVPPVLLEKFERWSDAGWDSCILREPAVRGIVEGAFTFFDESRYRLDLFVIMPNHVHLLFQSRSGWTLDKVLHSWKSYSAHEINDFLERAGLVWMDERFDHIVRSEAQLAHFRRYILNNPEKAGLKDSEYTLWCRPG